MPASRVQLPLVLGLTGSPLEIAGRMGLVTHLNEDYVTCLTSQEARSLLHFLFLFWERLDATLQWMSLPASNNCMSGDFTGQEGPGFLSLSCSLTANVSKFCHVSLTRASQHNVTNIMDPSDSLCQRKVVKMQANKIYHRAGELLCSCRRTLRCIDGLLS